MNSLTASSPLLTANAPHTSNSNVMPEITELLRAIDTGDRKAAGDLQEQVTDLDLSGSVKGGGGIENSLLQMIDRAIAKLAY